MFAATAGHRAIPRAAASLCLFFLWLPAVAGTHVLSLQDTVQIAVERAPMLDARRADLSAAREEASRSAALPDPVLTFGIDNLPITGADAFDTGADAMTMKTVGLRQDIPARAKRDARRNLAVRQIDEAQARADAQLLSVRRSAAESWAALWAARQELGALQALRAEAALAARLTKARVAGGGESPGNALAAEAALLELDNRIEAARADSLVAQAGVSRWLGDAGAGAFEVSNDAPDFDVLPIPESRLLGAIDRLEPLLPVTAQLETVASAVDVARAERHPDWSVAASYGQRDRGLGDMVMLEVGIGLPLFTRNRQDRGIAAREADYQAAIARREDLRRQETTRVRAGIARWEGLKRQVALHEASLLPLARDRSRTALAAYRAGAALQPWLDARRDELDARLSHARHLGELAQAWVALAYLLPSETRP